jgi:hypothetical protein
MINSGDFVGCAGIEGSPMKAFYEVRDQYLYVKAEGEFSLARAEELLYEWIEVARSHSLTQILYDITLVSGFDDDQVSILARFQISQLIAKMLPRNLRLAVLETPRQTTETLFDENVMINLGAIVKVTTHLNEALRWLGVDPTSG